MKWLAHAVLLLLVSTAAALDASAEQRTVVSSLPIDFDGNGTMDLAELVLINPNTEDFALNDNNGYWVGAAERVDLVLMLEAESGRITFVKQKIVDPELVAIVSALESRGKGSLAIRSCYGCGAMASWEQTLTIAYRRQTFVVAGYSKFWEWYHHTSDGDVEGKVGECDINFLSGDGTASRSAQKATPLKARFKPVKLADWPEAIPKACMFD
jgi:hypothetical protein